MTERIEYNTILDVTEDEVAMHLLISLKFTVKLAETGSPIRNTPHSTIRVFCETKVVHSQHNTEANTDHNYQEDN